MSIAVVYKGKRIWEKSFGMADKEKNIRATVHTPYYLASVTKTITATAIMELNEMNRLNIDSPANNYLGKGKLSSFLWNVHNVTIRQILNQTSGLTTYHNDCYMHTPGCPASMDSTIEKYGIIFWQPGDHFDYSNIGYGILGEIVRHASGKSFASFLHDNLFEPLGMKNSFLGVNLDHPGIAVRYRSDSAKSRSAEMVSYTTGASSGYSSVDDLATFALFHLKHTEALQKKVLSGKGIDEMKDSTVPAGDPDEYYGLGWHVNRDFHGFTGVLAQGGTNDGNAWLQLVPEKDIAVIFLSNTGMSGDVCQAIINETLSAVLPEFKKNLSLPKKPASQAQAAIPPAIYGTWGGSVHTYDKDIPFKITFSGNGGIAAVMDNQTVSGISALFFSNNRFFFDMPGDLHTSDTGAGPYNIGFELFLRDGKLYGALTANTKAALPFWVVLSKL